MHSIKPGRGPSFMGGVGSLFAVGFGIIWTIIAFEITQDSPFPVVGWAFPLFGIVFIISGLASAAYNFFNATTKKRLSIIDITSPGEEPDPLNSHFGRPNDEVQSTEERLNTLEKLRTSGAISESEFSEQRRRILDEI
jgi:hypothetical protein